MRFIVTLIMVGAGIQKVIKMHNHMTFTIGSLYHAKVIRSLYFSLNSISIESVINK